MIFGAIPDDKEEVLSTPKQQRKVNPVWMGVSYFTHHPKTKMYQVFSYEDLAMLGKSIKSLLRRGLSPADLRRAIDRFYSSEFAQADRPALFFTKTARQENTIKDMAFLSHQGYMQQFSAYGFERMDDLELPWDEKWDYEIKQRCIDDPESAVDIMKEYCGAV